MILNVNRFAVHTATLFRKEMHNSYNKDNSRKFKDVTYTYDTVSQLMCIHDTRDNSKMFIPSANIPQMVLEPEQEQAKRGPKPKGNTDSSGNLY